MLRPTTVTNSMREISTSISSYEAIVSGNYLYVDKTAAIYDVLVSRPGHYFLARPRRFGKSLLVSTLEMIFKGRKNALKNGDVNGLIDVLKVLFSNVPYSIAIQKERYYQTIFYLAMLMMNYRVVTEECTNIGRIDMTVETNERIYILEFKLDGDAKAALVQIKTKNYAEKYKLAKKKIIQLGISFGKDSRNVEDFAVEEL